MKKKPTKTDKLMLAAVAFYHWMDERCEVREIADRFRICESFISGSTIMIRKVKKKSHDTEILVFRGKKK